MRRRAALVLTLVLGASAALAADGSWPRFRGPSGDGRAPSGDGRAPSGDGRAPSGDVPLRWSESENIRWKTAIHGRGWSSPVVAGGQVWITTATEDGRRMHTVGVDAATGKVLHDVLLFENQDPEPLGNEVNCYASPTCAIEQGRVYAHFGSYGTAALDTATGKTVWERRDLPCRHFRGPGSSPILFEDLLVLTMDGFDVQYLVALDKRTGRDVWKTDRSFDFSSHDGDFRKAYSTPIVLVAAGRLQMVSSGSKATYSYDPRTGRELWRVRYDGFSNAAMPILAGGLLLVNTGFSKADLLGVRPDGAGDVTDTHVAWRVVRCVPLKPSPVADGDLAFLVADTGIATCLDARTGETVWQERIGGEHSASPVLAAGRVYAPSQDGNTVVLRAGRTFEVLATNRLDDGCMASPAVVGRAIFLRTRTHLYRIEE